MGLLDSVQFRILVAAVLQLVARLASAPRSPTYQAGVRSCRTTAPKLAQPNVVGAAVTVIVHRDRGRCRWSRRWPTTVDRVSGPRLLVQRDDRERLYLAGLSGVDGERAPRRRRSSAVGQRVALVIVVRRRDRCCRYVRACRAYSSTHAPAWQLCPRGMTGAVIEDHGDRHRYSCAVRPVAGDHLDRV